MSARHVHKSGLSSFFRQYPIAPRRTLHTSRPRHSFATSPLAFTVGEGFASSGSSSSSSDARHHERAARRMDLQRALSGDPPDDTLVWTCYRALTATYDHAELSPDTHKAVLRLCTPVPRALRHTQLSRNLDSQAEDIDMYETRLKGVISIMRSAGHPPDLDDYHEVMKRFAAIGHYMGAIHFLKELQAIRLQPDAKTYGLCLQALAHRQSLPSTPQERPIILSRVSTIFQELIEEMSNIKLPLTPANVDLATRIFKESTDDRTFSNFVRMSYGIDLYNPDGIPLEQMEQLKQLARDGTAGKESTSAAGVLVPFSTSALNSILRVLGRRGNVSRLVTTFEVLTQPLPTRLRSSWPVDADEDDDGDGDWTYSDLPDQSRIPTPYTHPDSSTYNILLRYVCQSGNAVLARHYLLEALWLDLHTDRALRGNLMRIPMDQIPSPNFAMNREMFNSVIGLGNRGKNVELLQLVLKTLRKNLRRKRVHIEHYSLHREHLFGHLAPGVAAERGSNILSRARKTPVFELDLEDTASPAQETLKVFNLDHHIRILENSVSELEQLEEELVGIIARIIDKVKERLGRRVWRGKNVFRRSTSVREIISRPNWHGEVNFKADTPNQYHSKRRRHGFPFTRAQVLPSFVDASGSSRGKPVTEKELFKRGSQSRP